MLRLASVSETIIFKESRYKIGKNTKMAVEQTNSNSTISSYNVTTDDAAWILTNAFLIFTMQSGFALLESGCVSSRNSANIMIKNMVDVTVGGLAYWMFGYALTFGTTDRFGIVGGARFFVNVQQQDNVGSVWAHYFFQLSVATTATTIVSGAVAERMKLNAYIVFSFVNILIYSVPAAWVWNDNGFLKKLGFLDFAGGCVVHFVGGSTALVASYMIGPRLGRYNEKTTHSGCHLTKKHKHDAGNDDKPTQFAMSSPVTALTGTFMLWWAWLGFNCGSSLGIHKGRWEQAALAGVNTLNGSVGGSVTAILLIKLTRRHYDIRMLINALLAGLVSVNSSCGLTQPHWAIVIGAVGGLLCVVSRPLFERVHIDDPVGVISVHMVSSAWGVLAVGLFGQHPGFGRVTFVHEGLIVQGQPYLLFIQVFGLFCVFAWVTVTSWAMFSAIRLLVGLRVTMDEEILGADWSEHRVRSENLATKLESALNVLNVNSEEPVDDLLINLFRELLKPRQQIDATIRPLDNGQAELIDLLPESETSADLLMNELRTRVNSNTAALRKPKHENRAEPVSAARRSSTQSAKVTAARSKLLFGNTSVGHKLLASGMFVFPHFAQTQSNNNEGAKTGAAVTAGHTNCSTPAEKKVDSRKLSV